MEWLLQLPVLFFSVVVHEFSHGWAAYRRGDDTAESSGRLTLNPLAHIDAFGTVFLPLLCFLLRAPMFGWARPVPVNPARLRRPARDMVGVALAGPAANLALALAAAAAYKLVSVLPGADFRQTALDFLLFGVTINLFLAFFNLVPIYPLDGCRIVGGLLPPRLARLYDRHMPYGVFLILLVLFTGLSAAVRWPMEGALALLSWVGLL